MSGMRCPAMRKRLRYRHAKLCSCTGGTMSNEIETEWNAIWRQITAHIGKQGQFIQVVHLTKDDPPDTQPFMYTIGNYQAGFPELLIVGTDKTVFVDVLNRLGKLQRERGKALEDEELVSVGGKFPLRIVDAGEIGRRNY